MKYYKICPTCNEQNSVSEMICTNCLSDISGVQFETHQENTNIDNNKTILENNNVFLEISFDSKNLFKVYSKEILGRDNKCKDFLEPYQTVSRSHLEFNFENDNWYIKDLNSTNGTFLNGTKLDSNSYYKITDNDEVFISKQVSFTVSILR